MPGPLFTTLISIPWMELLKQAPNIVKAAEHLLSGTLIKRKVPMAADELAVLKERVEALETHDLEDAKLVKQLADQLEILTFSTRIMAMRLKLAIGLAALGILTGLSAVVLFFVSKP